MIHLKDKEVEDYGRQIFEAISYANEFPVVKEKLLIMFDKLIEELSELIDEDELNDYKKAKKVVEKIPENEVEELCFTVESLYGDVLKEFEIKL
ncbi:hypothetical protein HZ322_11980 (plasmid) [Lactococcus lactis]|nr:hypothetical protein HZ322_11980 [Lactococcus lactis]